MTGVLLLDKHEGITSFRAASQLRRIFGEKKIGHTGTLDPMASGLLPVLLGGATRFSELLVSHDKAYRATFLLGVQTDTLDITGAVVCQRYVDCGEADVLRALDAFRGRIRQYPPMYSAVSQNGVRLYKLARQGVEVERPAREVEIYRLELVSSNVQKGEYIVDVRCSAGTYIRSLVCDLGEALGCGAVLTALRRTEANGFFVRDAHTLDELRACPPQELRAYVLPIDRVLSAYPAVAVTEKQAIRFKNGGALDLGRLRGVGSGVLHRVYGPDGVFLGLGELRPEQNELAVRRLLTER
ncbi:MAG: tRNA pseudouridine(55) synthase TruB [Clostridia bacterium]|nr:tRNA pseudouridine(55) synthase TruB [Clostridia bacterium]MBQ7542605.1 tRNA pseudouridine(55) synthase TruB [Clostridia bacterium]